MKRIIFLLASVLMLTAAMVGLSSCNAEEHQHEMGREVIENRVEPTCTEDGHYDKVIYCSSEGCGKKIFTIETPITKLGHAALSAVEENRVEPTCVAEGHYDSVVYCSREGCGAELSRTEISISKTHQVVDGYCIFCNLPESSPGLAYWENDDGTYTVAGIGSCTDTDIVIGLYNGKLVTAIGDEAFYDCESLTSVTIGNSITSIGDSAFSYCSSLTSITIGNSVTSIGEWAFYNCNSLTSIIIPDSVTSVGNRAFRDCDSLTSITVDTNNTAYKSIDGNLYTKDGKTLIQYAIGKTDTSFTIPDSVTSICKYAFSGCRGLTSVTIGNSVTSIGEGAFWYCTSLANLTIPDSVTSIGYMAFYNCTKLTDVYYTGTAAEWAQISIGSNNENLTSATIHYNYVPEE